MQPQLTRVDRRELWQIGASLKVRWDALRCVRKAVPVFSRVRAQRAERLTLSSTERNFLRPHTPV
jgi:hypothetical protein